MIRILIATLAALAVVQAVDLAPGALPGGGLAVIAGASAEANAMRLAAQGRWLVRVVADKADQVSALARATAALHPLVTVDQAAARLPFAPDTVNAVVLGAGATISAEEAHRVLAPDGILLTEAGFGWKREVEPEDPRLAPWTHFQADAHATGVSQDTAVAPSTSFRWWGQNIISSQLRTAAGVVCAAEESLGTEVPKGKSKPGGLHGRDVYSGVALWYRAKATNQRNYDLRSSIVGHPLGFIHVQGGEMQPAVLSDLRTGQVQVTYDQGLKMPVPHGDPAKVLGGLPAKGNSGGAAQPVLLVWKDLLIQGYGMEMAALEIPTGKLVWKQRLTAPIARAIVSRDGTRLFIQETDIPTKSYLRWGTFPTVAIAARSLADGKELWRNTAVGVKGTINAGLTKPPGPGNGEGISELIEVGPTLFGFDESANIGDQHGDLFSFDAATGNLNWHFLDYNGKVPGTGDYRKTGSMYNNPILWNGGLWSKSLQFSLTEPKTTRGAFPLMTGNDRCVRYTGSANFMMTGFNSYIGTDFTSYQTGLTRGNCAMPNFATYGSILSVTDETCSCYNGPRGQIALIPPLPVEPVAAGQRLVPVASLPAEAPAALPDTALTLDWIPWPSLRFFADHKTATPVTSGDLTLRVDVQRHLVTAQRGSEPGAAVAWRFRADGRVFTAPTMGPAGIYISSAAGTITCLDPTTGAPRWRFLAAPMRAECVVNGQLESRWPVYSTVLHDGLLYAAAGRHAETDDGIWLWALDPASGAIRHASRLFVLITVVKPGEATPRGSSGRFRGEREIASTALLCGGVAIEDGQVVLISRWWNKSGSRPTDLGFWKGLKDPKSGGPDLNNPAQRGFPLDLAAWNGGVINPIDIQLKNGLEKGK